MRDSRFKIQDTLQARRTCEGFGLDSTPEMDTQNKKRLRTVVLKAKMENTRVRRRWKTLGLEEEVVKGIRPD